MDENKTIPTIQLARTYALARAHGHLWAESWQHASRWGLAPRGPCWTFPPHTNGSDPNVRAVPAPPGTLPGPQAIPCTWVADPTPYWGSCQSAARQEPYSYPRLYGVTPRMLRAAVDAEVRGSTPRHGGWPPFADHTGTVEQVTRAGRLQWAVGPSGDVGLRMLKPCKCPEQDAAGLLGHREGCASDPFATLRAHVDAKATVIFAQTWLSVAPLRHALELGHALQAIDDGDDMLARCQEPEAQAPR